MIKIIPGTLVGAYPDLFDQIYRLRHRVFVEEMGWQDLECSTGRETDQFDNASAIHLVAIRDGQVAGYMRTIPTLQPHLLTEVLPYLCEGRPPRSKHTWEVSRYCVSKSQREGRRAMGSVGSELIAGVVEWALAYEVTDLVFEFEVMWIVRALQLQFLVEPLGRLQLMGKQQIVAARLSITSYTLPAIRTYRDHFEPVIEGTTQTHLAG